MSDKLPHGLQCCRDPTKTHYTVGQIMNCPACRPEFVKAWLEKERREKQKQRYIM